MTKEDRKLLLVDLCARLPYGVKCKFDLDGYLSWNPDYKKKFDESAKVIPGLYEKISNKIYTLESYPCKDRFFLYGLDGVDEWGVPVEFIKPYLRPMSSMTEREKEEFQYIACGKILDDCIVRSGFGIKYKNIAEIEEWLNTNNFDFRGLIEKGISLEAPKGLYLTFGEMKTIVSIEHK